MGRAYSIDLRERVVAAVEAGGLSVWGPQQRSGSNPVFAVSGGHNFFETLGFTPRTAVRGAQLNEPLPATRLASDVKDRELKRKEQRKVQLARAWALLRHADCIEQYPLLRVARKTFAQAEFFRVRPQLGHRCHG
jgi:hypothetical protein